MFEIITNLNKLSIEEYLDFELFLKKSVTIHSLSKIAESLPHLVMRKCDYFLNNSIRPPKPNFLTLIFYSKKARKSL